MFLTQAETAPARVEAILAAAEAAGRAVPPAFPLDATVAVNPFLGQTETGLAETAARLARVAGVPITRERKAYAAAVAEGRINDDDLSAALLASSAPGKPGDLAALKTALGRASAAPVALPTVADLAAAATGTDWPEVITNTFGLWAAGHFDRGQALWTPAPGQRAFAAWRAWAVHDLTPELAGLRGFSAHVGACPDTPERAILRAADALGLTPESAETAFHRLLMDLGGWAQHGRWLLWQAELAGEIEATLTDLLAIRLVWEEALLAHAEPAIGAEWQTTLAAHAVPPEPTSDQVIDAILQEAAERAHQRRLSAELTGTSATPDADAGRPELQAAFCIDVRSEVFRRALEAQDPAIDTIGFAGFFGLTVTHSGHGSDLVEALLPVLLTPGLASTSQLEPKAEATARIGARAARAWARFRQAAVSSFAFVEAVGPLYGGKLVRDALGMETAATGPDPAPRFVPELDAETKAATGAAVLNAMSMAKGHARLVLLLGHGGNMVNNPHESAYHCGACGGYTGEVSARLLAQLLNDPETRAGLPALGIELPVDTHFVAGLHDTTTDVITLYEDVPAPEHKPDIARAKKWLAAAGISARTERALSLPGATPQSIAERARNWAEIRPEWGLAGCAAFVAAPRDATRRVDLGGRSFLHSYDWRADKGFGTLELIITAPVVVASWISLQYYGSSVAPDVFGGGNKLIHNVVGGMGVVEGNGGRLRPGLPWQTVHDGIELVHEPLRLSVLIEAPRDAMLDILARHDAVRALFDNGWLHLLALEDGQIVARYRPGLAWEETMAPRDLAA